MDVKVPDIGDFSQVPVVSILVSVGDQVDAEDPLIELESDKATMEVPSPAAGTVKEIKVAEGDNVSEGSVILVLEGAASEDAAPAETAQAPAAPTAPASVGVAIPAKMLPKTAKISNSGGTTTKRARRINGQPCNVRASSGSGGTLWRAVKAT